MQTKQVVLEYLAAFPIDKGPELSSVSAIGRPSVSCLLLLFLPHALHSPRVFVGHFLTRQAGFIL